MSTSAKPREGDALLGGGGARGAGAAFARLLGCCCPRRDGGGGGAAAAAAAPPPRSPGGAGARHDVHPELLRETSEIPQALVDAALTIGHRRAQVPAGVPEAPPAEAETLVGVL